MCTSTFQKVVILNQQNTVNQIDNLNRVIYQICIPANNYSNNGKHHKIIGACTFSYLSLVVNGTNLHSCHLFMVYSR